jgi:hypothetical protein
LPGATLYLGISGTNLVTMATSSIGPASLIQTNGFAVAPSGATFLARNGSIVAVDLAHGLLVPFGSTALLPNNNGPASGIFASTFLADGTLWTTDFAQQGIVVMAP